MTVWSLRTRILAVMKQYRCLTMKSTVLRRNAQLTTEYRYEGHATFLPEKSSIRSLMVLSGAEIAGDAGHTPTQA